MAPPTVFSRPKRQILPSLAHAQRVREVCSEAELRAALGAIAAGVTATAAAQPRASGNLIVWACDIAFDASVEVPQACSGLTIDGRGFRATARTAGIGLFSLPTIVSGGLLASFRNIDAFYDGSSGAEIGESWGLMFDVGDGCRVDIENCHVSGGLTTTALIDCAGTDRSIIRGCRMTNWDAVVSWMTFEQSTRCIVQGNVFHESSAEAVVLGTGCADNAVGPNAMSSNGIITTASSGGNTIIGNANAGTLTLHAGDEEAANTP